MQPDDDWELTRGRGWDFATAGAGMLRATLLFGTAGIALALILTPLLDGSDDDYLAQSDFFDPGVDRTVTGSVGATGYKGQYTIRRSVLQGSPDSICVIRDNGAKSGDC
ncbi:MAG: hypothetical protein KF723_16195 [Rhizobiaceae bacterium]|nr:hypothetical protein [Rhizobiaceae bacterium]